LRSVRFDPTLLALANEQKDFESHEERHYSFYWIQNLHIGFCKRNFGYRFALPKGYLV
jgi:hypothetical protein